MALEIKRRLPDGSFGDPVKPFGGETDKEKIVRLEANNADLMYGSMMKELEIDKLKNTQAELLYQLMMGGII